MTKKTYNIALFFTFGTSLQIWKDSGLFSREIKPYLELSKLGHKITFYTYGDQSDLEFQDELGSISIKPLLNSKILKSSKLISIIYSFIFPFIFYKEMKKHNIFKSNQMWGAWVPLIASKITQKFFLSRVGYELYEFNLNRKTSPLKRLFIYVISKITYTFSNAIYCTSKQTKDFIINNFSINEDKITVHSNYIDTELFKPQFNENKSSHILFIGRFDSHKNIPFLMDACKKSNFTLDLIGGGEEEQNLQAYARDKNITCNFLGKFPNEELPKIISKYQFFALTSKSEGNPKALLETMSCGLCPIGTNVPGIRDIINKDNGFLVEANEEDYSNALLAATQDKELTNKKSISARKYIEDNCSLTSLIETELALYP